MAKNRTLSLFFLLLPPLLSAQAPLGAFTDYLPYHTFEDVAVGKEVVYAATRTSLMLVDKNDGYALSTWSKVDGLSEVGISCIEYSEETGSLVVAYTNSNLDIITGQKLTNIPDIKNKQLSGAKTIHDIAVRGEKAYLSCAFGIVVINLKSLLIEDTWFTTRWNENFPVLTTTFFGEEVYTSTTKGVFHTPLHSYQIADFSSWIPVEELGSEEYAILSSFQDRLFAVKRDARADPSPMPQDTLWMMEAGVWQRNDSLPIHRYASVEARGEELLLCDFDNFYILDRQLNITYHGYWSEKLGMPMKAVIDGDLIWIADRYLGLALYFREHHYASLLQGGGPYSEMVESVDYADGVLALVPGTRAGWGISYHPASMSWYKENEWHYNREGYGAFSQAHDFNQIVINPKNPKEFYVGSWGGGVFQFVDGVAVRQYNYRNAPFECSLVNRDSMTLISALQFDLNGNLWIVNSQDSKPLKKRTPEGQFTTYSLSPYVGGGEGVMAEHLLCDSRGQIWITYPRSSSMPLVVFKEGTNGSPDQRASINMNAAAEISTTTVNAIAEDQNGQIWIGTEQGVKVVFNPGSVFEGKAYAQNILITQLGFTHPLLESEQVTCIAVDGGNRKWIGTAKAGLFLLSEDGTEELLHLTAENSPLFSNQIITLKINPRNGEVYIGTASGLISYKGQATEGREDYSEVLVYPNPVKDGYEGDIAVSGLMDHSFCKIADASGQLVCHGYAYGGQFIWNGKNYQGGKVASGVYFVFASDRTGKEKKVAKILIIR